MRNVLVLILCIVACVPLPASAQDKNQSSAGNAALEKELFALELKWMKAEFDKKMSGPDSMGELWTDEFFDVLPNGHVVNKQEMMDLMAKTDRQPGTGAFPDHFKLMAVYGNVALATDHTVIKGVDANGKIVVVERVHGDDRKGKLSRCGDRHLHPHGIGLRRGGTGCCREIDPRSGSLVTIRIEELTAAQRDRGTGRLFGLIRR